MYNSVWFNNLNKPFLNPPAEIFSPVWITLYIFMALSLLIYIIKKTEYSKTKGYIYLGIQLVLNLIWSPIFFMMKNIGLAMIVIILLDIFVFLTIKEFFKISKSAATMLIPYFIWILFATYLNGAYLYLN